MGHDYFLEQGGYGAFIYLGEEPTWSPCVVSFCKAAEVRDDNSGPAYRHVLKGPFASREEAHAACTDLVFRAVRDGTTGV